MENETGIRIRVVVKHPGNLTKKIKTQPFFLENTPRTLGELIGEAVKTCIVSYRERGSRGKDPTPLTEEVYQGMQEMGKFAFGVHYNDNEIHEGKALEAALEAVQDGIVRVFHGEEELTELDKELEIMEDDLFTFVRLTMLSGRLW